MPALASPLSVRPSGAILFLRRGTQQLYGRRSLHAINTGIQNAYCHASACLTIDIAIDTVHNKNALALCAKRRPRRFPGLC